MSAVPIHGAFIYARRAGKTEALRTASQQNAEACARDCRVVGPGCEWPNCSCPTKARASLSDVVRGWHPSVTRPAVPGFYERITLLGVSRDVWDGQRWRRAVTRNYGKQVEHHSLEPFHGVVCANQDVPWRLPANALVGVDFGFGDLRLHSARKAA